jgi:hypothetical protein
MKKCIAMGLLATLSLSALSMAGEENACMLEGEMTMMGTSIVIKDCMENGGLEAAQFKEACNGLSQMGAAMGGTPAKITYMAKCPLPAQGSCQNLMGSSVHGYYYARDEGSLAGAKAGCEMQGGTWK